MTGVPQSVRRKETARYTYVIVGGGMSADAAVRSIRSLDSDGSIALFSLEPDPPYDRPPLSKGMWKGKPLPAIFRHTEKRDVDMHLTTRIVALDPVQQSVTDNSRSRARV